jgi:hypothetical protein
MEFRVHPLSKEFPLMDVMTILRPEEFGTMSITFSQK